MKQIKYAGIVIAALVLRTCAIFLFGGDPLAGALTYRDFVADCNVFPVALSMLALTYGALLAVYLSFRGYWPGKPIAKGLAFGSLFGLLWVVGMVEAALEPDTSLMKEFLFGLCEVPPILSVGLLAGLLFDSGKPSVSNPVSAGSPGGIRSAIAIVLSILAGRFFQYAVVNAESGVVNLPAGNFFWTLAFGMTVGLLYLYFGHTIPGSPVVKGLLFGFVVFGIDWILFTQVVPVLFCISPLEWIRSYAVRSVLECFFVALGISVSAPMRRE